MTAARQGDGPVPVRWPAARVGPNAGLPYLLSVKRGDAWIPQVRCEPPKTSCEVNLAETASRT